MRAVLVAAAALAAAGAYRYYADGQAAAQDSAPSSDSGTLGGIVAETENALASAGDYLSNLVGGSMKNIDPAVLNDANVRAFLMVIRTGEGTADAGGYSRLYGGGTFAGFADHPRKRITAGGWTSTAAGAYQFLSTTWDETRRAMGLPDFSPASQDLGAVGRIAYRGALQDVLAGNFAAAVAKCGREWASLPGSPYGQPTISMARASAVFAAEGGTALA